MAVKFAQTAMWTAPSVSERRSTHMHIRHAYASPVCEALIVSQHEACVAAMPILLSHAFKQLVRVLLTRAAQHDHLRTTRQRNLHTRPTPSAHTSSSMAQGAVCWDDCGSA